MLYKYPQEAFPYQQLIDTNASRSKNEPEFEILDTGVFDNNKYFDVYITYAKYSKRDIGIKIEIINRGKETAPITLLPNLWFYNRWQQNDLINKPIIEEVKEGVVRATHERLGSYYLYYQKSNDRFFTENETNTEKLYGTPNESKFLKDAFNDAIIFKKDVQALKDKTSGTKFAPVYNLKIAGGGFSKYLFKIR